MTLDELAPWLFSRVSGGIRWGLERTERLLAGVGDPHRLFRSILIGGTNGKGSAAALCEAALRTEGRHRVGLDTSPHLVSFAERIRVDGRAIAERSLVEAVGRLRPAIEETGASFFEATTALAFLVLAEADVEVAVVEVGLGGRLDSTNVLSPIVTAVTNVSMDHAEYLGDSLEAIAREKAGIFKSGVPALVGEREPALERVLRRSAHAVGARYYRLDDLATVSHIDVGLERTRFRLTSHVWGERELIVPLTGRHQARNATLAAETLGLLPEAYRPGWDALSNGFAAVRWPGRLQVERIDGTTWVFDVAHNEAGAAALADWLDEAGVPGPRVGVVAILGDKNWQEMLRMLLDRFDALILTTAPTSPVSRRWNLQTVVSWIEQPGGTRRISAVPLLGDALREAREAAGNGSVVVTGSVHTVGDAMVALGLTPA